MDIGFWAVSLGVAMKAAMKFAMKISRQLRVKSTIIHTLMKRPTESNKNFTHS